MPILTLSTWASAPVNKQQVMDGRLLMILAFQRAITATRRCPRVKPWEMGIFTAMDVAKHGICVATIGAGLLEVFLFIAVETKGTLQPQLTMLPRLGQNVVDLLNSIGASSIEVFLGVASDPGAEGCEILMTPLFRTLVQATSAARATGRNQWAVISWRTDMCSSFRVVAGGW